MRGVFFVGFYIRARLDNYLINVKGTGFREESAVGGCSSNRQIFFERVISMCVSSFVCLSSSGLMLLFDSEYLFFFSV